jgi:iron(III)-enterobactin esterase
VKNALLEWCRLRCAPVVLSPVLAVLAGAVVSCSDHVPSNPSLGAQGGSAAAAVGGTNAGGGGGAPNPVVAGAGSSVGAGAGTGGNPGAVAGTGGDAGMGAGGLGGSAGAGGQPNPKQEYTEDPGREGNGDFEIGPNYTRDPDLTDQGKPKGKSFSFTMPLADSKIFDATDDTLRSAARKERGITVYVPKAYVDGTAAPFMVVQDGEGPTPNEGCFDIGCRLDMLRNALDNLTVSQDPARKLPAFIVISVQNGGGDSKGSERGLEYDTMSDRFARFINEEVLPAVLNRSEIKAAYPKIALTDNPWGRGVIGCSSGSAAALTMGWFRPNLFRRLLTYSGTFVDQQDDVAPEETMYPQGAWEYHSGKELIANSEKKPLRISLHVSDGDNGANTTGTHNWVVANQKTAKALAAKGYDYRFMYSKSTGHCAGKVFDETLADTLVWMWRGYHAD